MTSRLVGPIRYRIVYRKSETSRATSVVARSAPAYRPVLRIPSLVFQDAERGDIHLIETRLVERIVVERQDALYGEWREVSRLDPSDLT